MLVPELLSKAGGLLQREIAKNVAHLKIQLLGEHRCQHVAIVVSESKDMFNHTLGLNGDHVS